MRGGSVHRHGARADRDGADADGALGECRVADAQKIGRALNDDGVVDGRLHHGHHDRAGVVATHKIVNEVRAVRRALGAASLNDDGDRADGLDGVCVTGRHRRPKRAVLDVEIRAPARQVNVRVHVRQSHRLDFRVLGLVRSVDDDSFRTCHVAVNRAVEELPFVHFVASRIGQRSRPHLDAHREAIQVEVLNDNVVPWRRVGRVHQDPCRARGQIAVNCAATDRNVVRVENLDDGKVPCSGPEQRGARFRVHGNSEGFAAIHAFNVPARGRIDRGAGVVLSRAKPQRTLLTRGTRGSGDEAGSRLRPSATERDRGSVLLRLAPPNGRRIDVAASGAARGGRVRAAHSQKLIRRNRFDSFDGRSSLALRSANISDFDKILRLRKASPRGRAERRRGGQGHPRERVSGNCLRAFEAARVADAAARRQVGNAVGDLYAGRRAWKSAGVPDVVQVRHREVDRLSVQRGSQKPEARSQKKKLPPCLGPYSDS